MITQQSQIKINLPIRLKDYLESRSKKFGMPIAGYVKHLILNDISDLDFPTFEISSASEEKASKALVNRKKAVEITNVAEYLKKL